MPAQLVGSLKAPQFVVHANKSVEAQHRALAPKTAFSGRTVSQILRSRQQEMARENAPASRPPKPSILKDIAERGLPVTTPTGPKRKRENTGSTSPAKEQRVV